MDQEKVTSQLSLISSHHEVDNVRTFIFESNGSEWLAGQSQAYILPQADGTEEEKEHWFTISSAPSEGTINISTRISSSPFKKSLNTLKTGDEIRAHSLGGKFTWEESDGEPVILVAAGIGVTPFRSILTERNAIGKPLNTTLLYFNRTGDIPFAEELQHLSERHPEFQLKLIVGEPVTSEKIFKLLPDAAKQIHYISGPEPLVSRIGKELKEAGVTIKQDRFPGYDASNF